MKINEINIGRKNTSSQWLIPFRKIWLCKLPLQRGRILVAFNNLSLAMALWNVYHQENQKTHREFQHLFKANHFWPWTVLWRVRALCVSCLWSWPTGLTLRVYMCNNVQLWKFTPTNAQKINSANYFHLPMEQLLGTCQWCLKKN